MKLNISPEWLLRMAEKEANGIISVGGLVTRILQSEAAEGAPMERRCWMSNVEAARLEHGGDGPEYHAALDHPSTCLLPDGHEGPHKFTFDGDVTFEFATGRRCRRCRQPMEIDTGTVCVECRHEMGT